VDEKLPGSKTVKNVNWIEVKTCTEEELCNQLKEVLDFAEAEAIALAVELDADLLVIDEKKGRGIAKKINISITGLLGVLLIAKQKGMLKSVKDHMKHLQKEANFRISTATFEKVLALANEKTNNK